MLPVEAATKSEEVKLPTFLFSSLDYAKFVNKYKPNTTDKALSSYLKDALRSK